MHRLLRVLTHRRLTVTLFLVFLGLFCVGLVLPQRPLLPVTEYDAFKADWPGVVAFAESTGLDDLYRSLVMKIVFAVFVVQLLAYLALRSGKVWAEAMRPGAPPPDELPLQVRLPGDPATVDRLCEALARRRYRISARPDGLLARRHRFAPMAGLLLHASFIVLLAGGWVLKVRDFRGTVRLIEGQPFQGQPREYAVFGPPGLTAAQLPQLVFTPESIEPVFSDAGHPIDVRCAVRVGNRKDGDRDEIRVNRPLVTAGVDVLLMDYGLAPAVSVRDSGTRRRVDAVCSRLMVWSPGLPPDSFRIQRPPATVHVRFFPDHATGPNGSYSRSLRLGNPVLEVKIEPDAPDIAGASGPLRKGEAIRFGTFELQLDELRKWGEFQVIRQDGSLLVFGFLLMVLGSFFRLAFARRWVFARTAQVDGQPVLEVGARAEYFPVSFRDEWEAIVAEVGGAMDSSPEGS